MPSSARPFRSFGSTPVTTLPRNLTPAISRTASAGRAAAAAERQLLLGFRQFALQLAALVEQRLDARRTSAGWTLRLAASDLTRSSCSAR